MAYCDVVWHTQPLCYLLTKNVVVIGTSTHS